MTTLKDLLSKITLGPWEVKHSESKDAWNVVGTRPGSKYKIARVPYVVVPELDDVAKSINERNDNEAIGIAQAISAVPDLLDLVIKQQEIILKHCDDDVAEEAMEAYSKLENKLK